MADGKATIKTGSTITINGVKWHVTGMGGEGADRWVYLQKTCDPEDASLWGYDDLLGRAR